MCASFPSLPFLLVLALLSCPASLAGNCPAVTGAATHSRRASSAGGPSHGRIQDGQVVDHYFVDPVLKSTWAVIVDCLHPAAPASLLPVAAQPNPAPTTTPGKRTSNLSAQQWVLAGSPVRIWKDGSVRIELSGTAAESAPLGAQITVRTGQTSVLLRGIVRGPGSVELAGASKEWREP